MRRLLLGAGVLVGLVLWISLDTSGEVLAPDSPEAAASAPMAALSPSATVIDARREPTAGPVSWPLANRSQPFVVTVLGAPGAIQEIPVDLLFGSGATESMRIWVDASRRAEVDLTQRAPQWVDFAGPVGSASAQYVPPGTRAVALQWPECGVAEVTIVDGDGQPDARGLRAAVRSRSASWPHGRWHAVPDLDQPLRISTPVGGPDLELRVVEPDGTATSLDIPAPTAAESTVRRELRIGSRRTTTFQLCGLPDSGAWDVEMHTSGASNEGQGVVWTKTVTNQSEVALPSPPSHALVVVRRAGPEPIEFWAMAEPAPQEPFRRVDLLPAVVAASGRVLDRQGHARPGVSVRLEAPASGSVLATAVTSGDGTFRVFGPDPQQFPMGVRLMAGWTRAHRATPAALGMVLLDPAGETDQRQPVLPSPRDRGADSKPR